MKPWILRRCPISVPSRSPHQLCEPKAVRGKRASLLLVASSGLALPLIFLMELVVNRSVRRPAELESLLGIPFLLSIPNFGRNKRLRLRRSLSLADRKAAPRQNGRPDAPPWQYDHFIRPFSEAIRDRLVLFFELNGMNHKPKLVAVTGFSHGAGTSTVSAGLAAALSETGDGKVLLVDMNVGRPEVHPFFKGIARMLACRGPGRGACSRWGESLPRRSHATRRFAGSTHSEKVLQPDAAPQSKRLRLYHF